MIANAGRYNDSVLAGSFFEMMNKRNSRRFYEKIIIIGMEEETLLVFERHIKVLKEKWK